MKVVFTLPCAVLAIAATSTHAATFVMEKKNTAFSIDGNGGAVVSQQPYLWNTNLNNINQQWAEKSLSK